jgi:hypothetical protein
VCSCMCVMQVFFNPDALSIIHMQSQSATGDEGEETCHSVTSDNVSQVSQVSLLNISSSFFMSAQVNCTLLVAYVHSMHVQKCKKIVKLMRCCVLQVKKHMFRVN